jgi:hypothetical protein
VKFYLKYISNALTKTLSKALAINNNEILPVLRVILPVFGGWVTLTGDLFVE